MDCEKEDSLLMKMMMMMMMMMMMLMMMMMTRYLLTYLLSSLTVIDSEKVSCLLSNLSIPHPLSLLLLPQPKSSFFLFEEPNGLSYLKYQAQRLINFFMLNSYECVICSGHIF